MPWNELLGRNVERDLQPPESPVCEECNCVDGHIKCVSYLPKPNSAGNCLSYKRCQNKDICDGCGKVECQCRCHE